MLEKITSEKLAKSDYPLSHAIKVGNLVFTSGQLGWVGDSGSLADTVEEQTRIVLENIKSILETAGSSMANVIKIAIYVKNIEDIPAINQIYQEYFGPIYPARAAVEVATLAANGLVEIEAIALANDE